MWCEWVSSAGHKREKVHGQQCQMLQKGRQNENEGKTIRINYQVTDDLWGGCFYREQTAQTEERMRGEEVGT